MRTYHHTIGGERVEVRVPEDATDLELFLNWARRAAQAGPIALDTETTGLGIFGPNYRLRTVQFGDKRTAWVIHWERGSMFQRTARRVLENAPQFIIHNGPFDWLVLDRHAGVPVESLAPRTIDTKIKAVLHDPRQPQAGGIGSALKALSARYVDPTAPDTQGDLVAVFRSLGLTKETGWAGIDLGHPTYNLYAGLDVILAARLDPILSNLLDHVGVKPALIEYEHTLAMVCTLMERTGMVLDQDYTRALNDRLGDEADKYAEQAARYGVTSVNSTRQLAEAFDGMGESLTERTTSGAVRVDKAVLLALADMDLQWNRLGVRTPNPLANAVLRSKRAGKWRSSYAETFLAEVDADGRVHPGISTLAARTGRMSVQRPALQTLPSSDQMIRRCLLADDGHVIVSCDFQAVEMRVLAALADVKRMREGFLAGEDIHAFTARLIKGDAFTAKDRKLFKAAGFGKVYGGGTETLARQTGAPEWEIDRAVSAYDSLYPEIKRASTRWQREARGNGLVTVSATGRRLPLDRSRVFAVVNYQCQSAARDLLGQALIDMHESQLTQWLRLPIHDEVLASVPQAEAAEIAREIERCMTMSLYGVPIVAEAEIGGRSWGSLYGADY